MFQDYLQKFRFRMSFSGDGEDMVLNSFFESYNIPRGIYVDIGAYHPFRYSNTYFFYRRGWTGVNIEPTPGRIEKFNKYRKKDINLPYAISNKNEILDFYCFDEPALNSFDKKLSDERNATTPYKIIDTIKVQAYPLAEILDKHLPTGQSITFFDIDVEGHDYMVIQSNNWDKYRPRFIMIENTINLENLQDNEVYQLLQSKGYDLVGKTLRTLFFMIPD
jgi:FkbM family methyltransferase